MKGLSFYTLQHIALFEATLLQYAHFISAQAPFSNSTTSRGNRIAPTTSVIRPAVTPPSLWPPSATNDSDICGPQTCTIRLVPTYVSYPSSIKQENQTITATVIPYVTTFRDGSVTTNNSTFLYYGATNVGWTAPNTTQLTWKTFGTVLTYPTTYVVFPTPSLIINTETPELPGQSITTCFPSPQPIPLPTASTSRFVFPYTNSDFRNPAATVFSILDNEPTVSQLLGGDPRTCSHGIRTITSDFMTPVITVTATAAPPLAPIVHTSIAVLTNVGPAVQITLGPAPNQIQPPGGGNDQPPNQPPGSGNDQPPNGNGNGEPPNSGGGSGGNNDQNPNGGFLGALLGALGLPNTGSGGNPGSGSGSGAGGGAGSGPGTGAAAPTGAGSDSNPAVVINGQIVTPLGNGGVIIGGQTLLPGAVTTLPNGVPVSVGPGGVVVVGSSTGTVATITPPPSSSGSASTTSNTSRSSSSSSTRGVGDAVASGIGVRPNSAGGLKPHYLVLEGSVLFGLLGLILTL